MALLKDVIERFSRSHSKRAERQPGHGFVAHHGSGTNARHDDIKDISSTGLYLLTEERWLPGTVVSLTLQMKSPLEEISERRISLQAKCIRWGEDGVGLSFVLPNAPGANAWRVLLQNASEQSEPDGVLGLARIAKAFAFLSRICPRAAENVMRLIHGGLTKTRMANAVDILLRAEALLPRDSDDSTLGAPPRLVARILEDGSWAEEDWVQRLWAGLLATSCNDEGGDDSNQFFVDLFSKLAAVHVRILRYACMQVSNILPISGSMPSGTLVCTREEIMEVTGSRELLRIERDLEHLYNLGLLERGAKAASASAPYEAVVTPSTLGLQLYARCKGGRG